MPGSSGRSLAAWSPPKTPMCAASSRCSRRRSPATSPRCGCRTSSRSARARCWYASMTGSTSNGSPSAALNGTPHASNWKTSTSNWPPTAPPWPRAAPTCSPPRPKRHGHEPTSVASTNSPSAARCPSASATRPAPAPAPRRPTCARHAPPSRSPSRRSRPAASPGAACRRGSRSPRQRCTRPRSTWPTPRSSPLAMGGSARWACAWASTLLPARSCCSWCRRSSG